MDLRGKKPKFRCSFCKNEYTRYITHFAGVKGKGGAEAQACQKVPDDVCAAAQQHMGVAPQQKRSAAAAADDDDDVQEVQPSKQSRLSCGSSASRARRESSASSASRVSMQASITDSVQHRMPCAASCLSAASPSTCSGTLPGTRCGMQPERQGRVYSLSATTPSRQQQGSIAHPI